MEIKWYWLAEQIGLVEDISHQYPGGIHYTVSADAGDVFFTIFLLLIPVLFLLGLLLRFLLGRGGHASAGKSLVMGGVWLLLAYALLLAVGAGPYIQFYPQGAGFLDFSLLEHLFSAAYCALLALSLFLGGLLGRRLARRSGRT